MELTPELFRAHLDSCGLIPPGSTVLVGYSGGADSGALLHLLVGAGVDCIAAHLHHGMRPEADSEEKLCAAVAEDLGVPFVSGRADVPRIAADFKIGLEEAGRRARKEFFERSRQSLNAYLVATAHTRDDLVETVLFHMARGTGLAGLHGIPARSGAIVRPLLDFPREATREFCDKLGLWYHDDPANADVSFSRARLRHRVVPEMRQVHPGFDQSVLRMTRTLGRIEEFLNGAAAAALEQSEVPQNGNLRFLTLDCEAVFDRARLSAYPAAVVSQALRLVCKALGGTLEADSLETLLDSLSSGTNVSQTLEGGSVIVEVSDRTVHIRQARPVHPYRFNLTVPGETISDEFGWQFVAFESEPTDFKRQPKSLEIMLDRGAVKGSLYFRSAEPGDSIQPLGMTGSRKLSDLLGEAGLTQAARVRLPILCDMVGPVWVPGNCLSERVKILSETTRGLVVRFEAIGS